jgi:hypothetical protein
LVGSVEKRLETALQHEADASAEQAEVADDIRNIKAWLTSLGITDFGPSSASVNMAVVRDHCLGEWDRQRQQQWDAEAAEAAEAERLRAEQAAANAAEVAEAERVRAQEEDAMLDGGSGEVGNSASQDQQQVFTTEETAKANEDGHAPVSAAESEQTNEVTASVKDISLSGAAMPPQVATPASGGPAKDASVSGAAAPEQRIETGAQVKDASVSGSAAPGRQAQPPKVALPLSRPSQAQRQPPASGQSAQSQRKVLPAVSRKQKSKEKPKHCEAHLIHGDCRAQPEKCPDLHVLHESFLYAQIFLNARAANSLPQHTLDAVVELEGRLKRQRDQALNVMDNGPLTKIGSEFKFSKQGPK